MDAVAIIFGVASAATVLTTVWANCSPYGKCTWRVGLACMMLLAWFTTQVVIQGDATPMAWRYAVVITFGCAVPATFVAARHPSVWTWGLSVLLGCEIGLHGFFWSLWPHVALNLEAAFRLQWWYVLTWNAGTAMQLLMIFLPGVWDVAVRGGSVVPRLHRVGRPPAVGAG